MLVGKLGLVSIYLLFLSVQLNLKYTISDPIVSDSSASFANTKTGAPIEKSHDGKSAVQKLRVNKRYIHQEAYLVHPFVVQGIITYYIKVDETFFIVPPIYSAAICRSLLRGPPAAATRPC